MDSGLDRIAVASPCSTDWNAMVGDERRRFCASCRLHVHDLSAMTTAEAEALLRAAGGGRLCVRFFRRADGRVLTRDCPVGLRARVRRAWARAAALWCALWTGTAACSPSSVAGNAPVLPVTMGDLVPPSPDATSPSTTPPATSPEAVGPRAPAPGGTGRR
ncbi:MAG: hypothetical protein JNK15_18660 [Planctomycetes bacterium]|nr:hypothetical protein [Planctomycetota bacterium]